MEGLAKLPSLFVKDGTVTAGNAPGTNDGASAIVLMKPREGGRAWSSDSCIHQRLCSGIQRVQIYRDSSGIGYSELNGEKSSDDKRF